MLSFQEHKMDVFLTINWNTSFPTHFFRGWLATEPMATHRETLKTLILENWHYKVPSY